MDTGTAGTGTDLHTGTGQIGKFGTTSIPAPDTSVSWVQHQYRYRTLWLFRYSINTGTGHFGKFGTTSIPVLNTLVSSVHQYRYPRHRYGRLYRSWYRYRYTVDAGSGRFGKFGATSIPVPPHFDVKISREVFGNDIFDGLGRDGNAT